MEITDVRVRLVKDANERLRAVCSVTLEGIFVVRDVKIVEGTNGLFVAMPSRKISVPCPTCRTQNHLRARYCNECGGKLPPARIPADANGREKSHRDIAHPITASFRQTLQERVLEAYRSECKEAEGGGDEMQAAGQRAAPKREGRISDYDAIIADLKTGAGESSSAGQPVDGAREASGGHEPRPRRRRRGRRGSRREPGDETAPRRDDAREEHPATLTRWETDAPQPEETDRFEHPDDADGEVAAPARIDDAVTQLPDARAPGGRPGSDEQSAPEVREQPPPADTSDDEDDAPFGAGLL